MKYITPSLLNLEQKDRIQVANELIENGIKWIHYDVMDGHFVPNTAITVEQIQSIKNNTQKHIMDAHLMVQNPRPYFDQLINIVDYITFHYEAVNKNELLQILQDYQNKIKIGLAIKPNTSVTEIAPFLPYLNLVLVMSVEPGAGGQAFIESSVAKIAQLKQEIIQQNLPILIQVDGGINNITSQKCWQAQADALVAGTYLVFEPTKDKIATLLPQE